MHIDDAKSMTAFQLELLSDLRKIRIALEKIAEVEDAIRNS
jgi:hypothetical protein